MKHVKTGAAVVIRLERGEGIVRSLTEFCTKNKIAAAVFQGIGTCRRPELGFFDMKKGGYRFKVFSREFEVTSLLGNVSLVKGKPFVHAHAVLGGRGFEARTGHLKEAEVLATCEVVLVPLKGPLRRAPDRGSGLNLLVP